MFLRKYSEEVKKKNKQKGVKYDKEANKFPNLSWNNYVIHLNLSMRNEQNSREVQTCCSSITQEWYSLNLNKLEF